MAYTNTDGQQTITEASGRVTVTRYDKLWRRSMVQISQGGTLKRTLTYNWDTDSRLSSVVDSVAGTLSYTYDDRFDAIRTETSPTGTMTCVGLKRPRTRTLNNRFRAPFSVGRRTATAAESPGGAAE